MDADAIMDALHVLGYSLGEFATDRAWHATSMRDGITEMASGPAAMDAWRALWARLDPDADEEADPVVIIPS